eukprot:GEMP01020245.1.p1 GENE.GEMP01020245.1~~GEMP01020245.1.p1  ORF type:complete len:380 (-),score=70.51 GEMP01020245.1:1460-2599(-)
MTNNKRQFDSAEFLSIFQPPPAGAPQAAGPASANAPERENGAPPFSMPLPQPQKRDASSSSAQHAVPMERPLPSPSPPREELGSSHAIPGVRPQQVVASHASAHAADMELPFPGRGGAGPRHAAPMENLAVPFPGPPLGLPTNGVTLWADSSAGKSSDVLDAPILPTASPNIGLLPPVVSKDGQPSLLTPAYPAPHPLSGIPGMHQPMVGPQGSTSFCSCNKRKGESCTFCWAWDLRSETSAPSLWSASAASTRISMRSQKPPSGHYVIGENVDACIEGQRLLYVRPQSLTTTGGKVYIELIRTIPQPLYSEIEVLLVAGKQGTVTLKPEAIKKGKKLCVMIPSGLAEEQDYDVRVKFAGKTLHGSFPLEIRAAVEESD